jgi:deoxyribose-phosphate aldolase
VKFKLIGSNKIDFSIEICLLTDEEEIKACHISKQDEADFIKT